MRIICLLTILSLSLLFVGCSSDDLVAVDEQPTHIPAGAYEEECKWIYAQMNHDYLWREDLPDSASCDYGTDPVTFFKSLLSDKDRFSYCERNTSYSPPAEIVNMGFDGLIPALLTGTIDVAASGITITEERKKRVDFCDPYYQAGQGLMIRAGDEAKFQKIEDLHNKTIAVQIGTTGAEVAKGIPGTKIKAFNTGAEAFMDLKMKGCDAVITDRPVIGYFIVKNPRAAKGLAQQNAVKFDSEHFGFAVKKGNAALTEKINKALRGMREDGTYDKIYAKWFGAAAK